MVAWNDQAKKRASYKRRGKYKSKPAGPTIKGYKVRSTGKTGGGEVGYHLYGRMSSQYSLVRTPLKPWLMFVVNKHMNTVSVAGYSYFSDEGGTLRGVG